jgi:hypothetical protein
MAVLRRTFLLFLVLAVPAAVTALLYVATLYLLSSTNRTIDPLVLHYAAIAEFVAFLFLMVLDVRNRW